MVGVSNFPGHEILYSIMLQEEAIKKLKWWQFIKRYKANNKLFDMRILGAQIGFMEAMDDLEKAGIIKRIKK